MALSSNSVPSWFPKGPTWVPVTSGWAWYHTVLDLKLFVFSIHSLRMPEWVKMDKLCFAEGPCWNSSLCLHSSLPIIKPSRRASQTESAGSQRSWGWSGPSGFEKQQGAGMEWLGQEKRRRWGQGGNRAGSCRALWVQVFGVWWKLLEDPQL